MEETKKCPKCAEEVKAEAIVCRYCNCDFAKEAKEQAAKERSEKLAKERPVTTAVGKGCAFIIVAILAIAVLGIILSILF